jgi:hypothetical protein
MHRSPLLFRRGFGYSAFLAPVFVVAFFLVTFLKIHTPPERFCFKLFFNRPRSVNVTQLESGNPRGIDSTTAIER